MALKRMVLQIGMGTDIRGADYTKAAVRALRDALWHNSLSVAGALGLPVDAMQVEVTIGVPRPGEVRVEAVKAALPHGQVTVRVVKGGLDVPDEATGDVAIIASAAVTVRLDLAQRSSFPRKRESSATGVPPPCAPAFGEVTRDTGGA